jgi:myo-inositol 2-dehydrogenase/D-chiro-inositol 1-dehydrogenase
MVRFGIIGFGAWGRCYAEAIEKLSDVSLHGIATGNTVSLNEIQEKYHDAIVVTDYRELLSSPEINAIIIATPNHLHYKIGLDVLTSGKHLLVEKPFTLSVAESDALIQLAAEKNLRLAVGHQFRLSSLWGKIKEIIDAGKIGEPKYAVIELSRNPYRKGDDGWRYDKNRVGNWILEEPIHFFDLACWYFESFGKPVSINAAANTALSTDPELYDNLSAIVQFSNGSHAIVAQTLAAFEHHQMVKITGTKGSLWASWSGAMDRTLHPTFFLKLSDGNHVEEIAIEKNAGELFELEEQIVHFCNVIQGQAEIHCTGEDGRRAVALSLAAQESAQTGKIISLSLN